jgi:hypothetical protein
MALPIPHERAVTPVVEGIISDARTGAPIGGAMIRATPDVGGGEYKWNLVTTTATSDEQGRFRVLATEKAKWMYVLLLLEGGCGGKYVVTKDGYQPLTFKAYEFGSAAFNGSCHWQAIKRNPQLEPLAPAE